MLFESGVTQLSGSVLSLAHLQIWSVPEASFTLANSIYKF